MLIPFQLLPPGWWVKNSDGSFEGPKPIETNANDDDYDDRSDTMDWDDPSTGDPPAEHDPNSLDIEPDSEGWEDTGSPDVENVTVQCLLCLQRFTDAVKMLQHCIHHHNFDLVKAIQDSNFDYYATIRYINLIRKNVREGVEQPTMIQSSYELTRGEELLRPTLEDDALLYMIEDAVHFEAD